MPPPWVLRCRQNSSTVNSVAGRQGKHNYALGISSNRQRCSTGRQVLRRAALSATENHHNVTALGPVELLSGIQSSPRHHAVMCSLQSPSPPVVCRNSGGCGILLLSFDASRPLLLDSCWFSVHLQGLLLHTVLGLVLSFHVWLWVGRDGWTIGRGKGGVAAIRDGGRSRVAAGVAGLWRSPYSI